jgi:hypothetical protein
MTIPLDALVSPETELYRRVCPSQGRQHLVLDESRGCLRLSSAFFGQPRSSVVIEDQLREEGREPIDIVKSHPEDFLVAITAEAAFDFGQAVERTPTTDEAGHGEIVGKKTGAVKNGLLKRVNWIKAPDDLCSD